MKTDLRREITVCDATKASGEPLYRKQRKCKYFKSAPGKEFTWCEHFTSAGNENQLNQCYFKEEI